MYVFSLGMSVYISADYGLGLNDQLELSDSMDQLLSSMCEEDSNYRYTLDQVLQVTLTIIQIRVSFLPFSKKEFFYYSLLHDLKLC